ncbi:MULTISPECIES: sulfite exporter TauE/SafE family protein [Pontibacillus]|uniref:Probable membrane transporter protein n=1 Tax=Pontibacillus chungwhensis TaxID=265426 RepID=A0ABY8UW78_9BACI|nr:MULTISPECIES: sulfite exporter TauE/SafE family protein [Pontibacillus]MCD5325175.1 sulfite exporter TauE/SafE family protein [Pontibacillus sp. HN14]WIF97423.1 sulfite exporter TauE/SafE family protein [Pontibacillus chungwhensis]
MLIIGFFTAFVGSIAGIGGGTILVPSMLFLHNISDAFEWATPQKIVGISVVVMIFTGLSSTIAYWKSRRIDYKTGLIFLVGCLPGGVFGSWFNQFVEKDLFSIAFGALMIVISLLFFLPRPKRSEPSTEEKKLHIQRSFTLNETTYHYQIPVIGGFFMAFFVGSLSGLFGIGGGSLMVPAMILLFGLPAHVATATSMFIIFFLSISSSSTHILLGHVPWIYTLCFIPGAWIGGTMGAKVNQRMNGKTVEWILRIILILIGIRLIWDGIR